MKSNLILVAIVAGTAAMVGLYPKVHGSIKQSMPGHAIPIVANPVVPQQQRRIEVVFALDTTGSMGGLIQGAKENIWSIASTLGGAQGGAEVRMGLVAYRDRGDTYVTKVTDLTTDLDSMYSTLMDFQAQGGGDEPESVDQALSDAVNRVSWSNDPDTYRVIFLVGDAPAHSDFWTQANAARSFQLAKDKGIVINTIQCGEADNTRYQWEKIAQIGQGKYLQVEQSGSAVALSTPFDEQLATLSRELDDTRIFFGDVNAQAAAKKKSQATDKLNALASVASRAKRGLFNVSPAGSSNFAGDNELVHEIEAGRVELEKIPERDLPPVLQAMAPAAREDFVAKQSTRRTEIQQRILGLKEQRHRYVAQTLADADDVKSSLDYQIFEAVSEQAAEKGLKYEAPDY